MVVGGIWYGPLFGKKWAKIIGTNMDDLEACKEMQRKAIPLYVIQFILALFQAGVLAYYINAIPNMAGVENTLWIWAAFILPTVAGSSMWNNDSRKVAWSRFLIQIGYQLITLVIFAFVLSCWK